ncbi:MAG TPA: biopolymer transporter ExbD [Pirellulaceae bacterium]|nr:biopolymer transporter ExbD [Pirellulaceae bacterium]
MRLTSRSAKHQAKLDLPLTSMIDVVFLLLIYFIVTSSLIETERELDPGIKVQRATPTSAADLAPAVVDVVRGGPGFVYRLGGREITSAAELRSVLTQFENKIDGAFVRVDDDAPFDMAAIAIQACKDARFLTVSYVPLSAAP